MSAAVTRARRSHDGDCRTQLLWVHIVIAVCGPATARHVHTTRHEVIESAGATDRRGDARRRHVRWRAVAIEVFMPHDGARAVRRLAKEETVSVPRNALAPV